MLSSHERWPAVDTRLLDRRHECVSSLMIQLILTFHHQAGSLTNAFLSLMGPENQCQSVPFGAGPVLSFLNLYCRPGPTNDSTNWATVSFSLIFLCGPIITVICEGTGCNEERYVPAN